MSYKTYDGHYIDYEDTYDPPTDESTTLRCPNLNCENWYDPEGPERGETWHPTTFSEYQGEIPHGGMVNFYTDDAFECEECGTEAEEI